MEYGEGVLMIDAATDYLIKHLRIAQKKWHLTDEAMKCVINRVRFAETPHSIKPFASDVNRLGVLPSGDAVDGTGP